MYRNPPEISEKPKLMHLLKGQIERATFNWTIVYLEEVMLLCLFS